MTENIDSLLAGLNEQQRQAVLINDGSLLVFAGAGSGKTRVITTKIAYTILSGLARPWEILAVTFTNKACAEMRDRVAAYVGTETASQCMIRTFHSFGVWLLRRYYEQAGLSKNFTIYDDRESAALLQQCYPNHPKKDIDDAARKISGLKDRMQKPPAINSQLTEFYNTYQKRLDQTGNVDFADMILKSITLLKDHPDVREYIHSRFKVILVDEYQDSNTAQFLLLQLLKGPQTFLCVVGDDDQSIYRFRGAQVENILNFPKTFKDTKTVVLGRNYRCTEHILNAARDVITNNSSRAAKDLSAENSGGMKPALYFVNTEYDEAQKVIDILKRSPRESYNSTAVLYRTNAQSKAFEDRFIMNNIPYRIVGSLRFYDREEVRDAIALISLLANPRDSVAFERMVNKPTRGIGPATVEKIIEKGGNMLDACRTLMEDGEVKGRAATGLQEFVRAWESGYIELDKTDNSTLLRKLLAEFGIMEYYTKRDKDEHAKDSSRVENLNQLVNMLTAEAFCTGMEGIHAFLEYVSLDPSSLEQTEGKATDGVTLITMHNTKGLEFDRVFVTGMEDEIFPSLREGWTEADLEEERRICYVAFTRARKELYIISASSRMMWGHTSMHTPSRFLSEIRKEHIEKHDEADYKKPSYGYANPFASYNSYRSYRSSGTSRDTTDYSSKYIKPARDKYEDDWKPKATLIKKSKTEPEAKPVTDWKVGDRAESDLMGKGEVIKINKFGNKDILVIKFEDGRTGNFVSGIAKLKKI